MGISKFKLLVFLMGFCLFGCRGIGPNVLNNDRFHYNQAMSYSSNQELLLNMVRLRYDENPMLLKVGNISGSTSLSRKGVLAGTLNLPNPGRGNGAASSGAEVVYNDNPIISYTPLDDQAFTSSFLSKLDLYDVSLLLQSSWSIPRILRVGFQQVGTAYNAPSSARGTSSHLPEYQNFIDMTYVLRRMQLANAITGFYAKKGPIEELTLVIDRKFSLTAKEKAVLKKASVEIYHNKIILTNYPAPHKVYVVTRSMLGVLNYLSKGLLVPPEDVKRGVLVQTTYENGTVFDWQRVLQGMMKIHHSSTFPSDAIVSISYRGRWYFIKDSDNDSKQTLNLLYCLTGLIQRAPVDSAAPPGLARTV
jgi:hypothetical protein